MRVALAVFLAGIALASGLWALNDTMGRVIWGSEIDKAVLLSRIFADQISLALSVGDEVALGWAVRQAVMGEILYAQVVTDGAVRVQDTVAGLKGMDLSVSPPQGEFEVRVVSLPGIGHCVDVKRRLYGRGEAAGVLLGYVRVGFSARRAASACGYLKLGTALGGALLYGILAFGLFPPRPPRRKEGGEGRAGEIRIDAERKEVFVRGKAVNLSPKEYELLLLLASSPGRVFSVREIRDAVWPDGSASLEEVKRYIYLLRRKIEEDPRNPRHILTVKGFGYRFEP